MGFIHSIVQHAEVSQTTSQQKNWRGIAIAILVICFVLALIVVAIILVSPKKVDIELGEVLTLDEIIRGDFEHRRFDVHWLPDSNVYLYRSADNELLEYDIDKNLTELVMSNSTFRELNTNVSIPSPDHSYILIAYDIEKVREDSFRAKYKIYNRHATTHKTRFIHFPQGSSWENRKLDLVTWSPNSQSISFVFEQSLFLQYDPFSIPVEIPRINDDRQLYYGIADPLYEDEIFGSAFGHWWSTQGSYICYLVIDDSNVPVHRYPVYGNAQSTDSTIVESSYPKAGLAGVGSLPTVRVFVSSASNPGAPSIRLRPPHHLEKMDHYVTNVVWADDVHVAVVWLNRRQTLSIVVFCEAKFGHCRENLIENAHDGQEWLTPLSVMRFVDGEPALHTFLTLLSKRDGTSGFWRHVAMVSLSLSNTGVRVFLTEGLWEATDVVGYDSETNTVFYIATNQDPRSRHLFRVSTQSSAGRFDVPVCLTCHLADRCQYVHASFSPSGKYYILHCLGPDVPKYILKNTLNDDEISVENNTKLRSTLARKAIPTTEFHSVDSEDGHKFWVKVQLPPVLRKEQIYVYPMVVLINEWPGSQLVTWQYSIDFSTYLASADNVVVVMADGRGSGGRGDRWRHAIHRKVGTIDLRDQFKAALFVRDSFHYIDKDRVAVWGKSYGGYLAIRALGNESNIFTCGAAVSPITNWRHCNAFTAEKLLGLVYDETKNNYKIYNDAQVTVKSDHYRGKHLLLVHGTADEKVHLEHTAQLTKLLTEADADFNVQLYTDATHSLEGVLRHMYHTTTKFLKGYCWNGGKRRQPVKTTDGEGD